MTPGVMAGGPGATVGKAELSMIEMLARNWWALALRGLFALLFGILALALPGITAETLILLFGIFAIADGIFAIVAAVRAAERHERWGAMVIEGIVGILAGLVAIFIPIAAALALVLVVGAWAFVTGILELVGAVKLRREIADEWLLVIDGVLSILLGLLMLIFPGAGLVALVWIIGIYALLFGIALIALAVRLRGHAHPPHTP